ncbi:MAG: SURF1 family protein [Halioglobus sp.]
MSNKASAFQFYPEWRISLVTAVLLPFLVFLGFWQLERAQEKAALARAWEQRSHEPPAPVSQLLDQSADALSFKPVSIAGEYVQDAIFLIDNRMHKRQFGYEVAALFKVEGADLSVLVNRGWLVGDPARQSLPEVPHVSGFQSLTGHVYAPSDKPYLLAEQTFAPGWPKIIQAVEMEKISEAVQNEVSGDLFPYLIRLDSDQTSALTVDWKVINVSPEKHKAYAFQWFAMAIFLSIFYLLRSTNLWQLLPFTKGDQN